MTLRARRGLLLAASAMAALSLVTGTARADAGSPVSDPSVTDPTVTDPTVTDPASSPATSPSETPSPSPTSPEPTSSDPAPGDSGPSSPATDQPSTPTAPNTWGVLPPTTPSTPAPAPAPAASTSPPAIPPVDPALPPNDGVGPTYGQIDEYLRLTATRPAALATLASANGVWSIAHATTVWYQSQAPGVAHNVALAQAQVAAGQKSTDDVVRALYQRGDSGLGALATVLSAGPQGVIDGISSIQTAHQEADDAALHLARARIALTLAQGTQAQFLATVAHAQQAEASAHAALVLAQSALSGIDARLVALAITPPQVAVGPDGCPTVNVAGTLRDGADVIGAAALCRSAVHQAATPQAALAIEWAFQHLGAAYACGGAGRMLPFRADCSSFVSRAYHEGAGLSTATATSAPSTRNMVPWDGVALDPHYAYVAPQDLRPGDLVLYNTCPQGGCPYRHVVMYLGSPDGGRTVWMIHTDACGDVAKIETFWGLPASGNHPFLVARRVVPSAADLASARLALTAAKAKPAKPAPAKPAKPAPARTH